jgi:hypothetical protein
VDTWADLGIRLKAQVVGVISWTTRLLVLVITALMLSAVAFLAGRFGKIRNA